MKRFLSLILTVIMLFSLVNIAQTETVETEDGTVTYNDAGQPIHSFSFDKDGNMIITSAAHTSGGALLMSAKDVYYADGGYQAERHLFDAQGNIIRKELSTQSKLKGFDQSGNTVLYDAQGKLLERSFNKSIQDVDGNEIYYRRDTVDAKGRETFFQRDGGRVTSVYYTEDGDYRLMISEGDTTTTYDGMHKVVSKTTEITDDIGITRVYDENDNCTSYYMADNSGYFQAYYADGKPLTITSLDEEGQRRTVSYDHDGYIDTVDIWYEDKNYGVTYDGDGKAINAYYSEGSGRSAYYDVAENQWYSFDDVPIPVPEFAGEIDLSDIETGGMKRPPQKPKGVWYPDNNACAFGIPLRDLRPDLTDKWYTVTPIDVSKDGMQTFELYGGNMWIIGQVNVLVEGDNVTVTYDIIQDGRGRTKVNKEYFNIFSDLGSITKEALDGNAAEGQGYQYGKAVSIEKDLGGDTNVLLYVRNKVTFNTRVYGNQFLVRMWPNRPHRKEMRTNMLNMMDPYEAPAK